MCLSLGFFGCFCSREFSVSGVGGAIVFSNSGLSGLG